MKVGIVSPRVYLLVLLFIPRILTYNSLERPNKPGDKFRSWVCLHNVAESITFLPLRGRLSIMYYFYNTQILADDVSFSALSIFKTRFCQPRKKV